MNYNWCTNYIKLARVKAKLGSDATEADLKAEYARLGGYVKEEVVAPFEFSPMETEVNIISEDTSSPTMEVESVEEPVVIEEPTNVDKPSVLAVKKKAAKTVRKK